MMVRREPGYRRASDAQLNADALARRDAPYKDRHAASQLAALSGPQRYRGLDAKKLARGVVHEFSMEAPLRLHRHDEDGVVGKVYTAEFLAYLEASPDATDHGDPDDIAKGTDAERAEAIVVGYYRWPNRATLWLMERHKSPRIARLGCIVREIVNGFDLDDAAIHYGAHPDDALDTARRALETFVSRRASLKMRLPQQRVDDALGTV